MALLWDKSLSINYERIDNQHKNIIESGRRIQEALASGIDRETCLKFFRRIMLLAESHFETEEFYLEQNGYPGLEAHQLEHKKAVQQSASFTKSLEQGDLNIVLHLAGFMADWLMNHIRTADIEYCRFITQKNPISIEAEYPDF